MKTLKVDLREKTYEIHIADGLLFHAGEYIKPFINDDSKVAIISDENVWGKYGGILQQSLNEQGIAVEKYLIKPGEESKNIKVLAEIYDWLGEGGRINRNSLLVAFGGGVVGDITGLAAATWMRGIRYIQIPTTLLAQVDSSIGGKTAIDTKMGKNLVGAFHQPKLVLIDPSVLSTLPDREFRSGMAEVIKYGVIASKDLFAKLLKKNVKEHLEDVIYECCSIKKSVVAEDEFDVGKRAILNFGHTFGHAIEAKYGFKEFTHGEAVAQGMLLVSLVGLKLGITKEDVPVAIEEICRKYELPLPRDGASLIEYIKSDKKALTDSVNLVIPVNIGEVIVKPYKYEKIAELLGDLQDR